MAYYGQGRFFKKCVERGQELWLGNTVSTKAAKRGREGCFRVKKAMRSHREPMRVIGENHQNAEDEMEGQNYS